MLFFIATAKASMYSSITVFTMSVTNMNNVQLEKQLV